MNSCLLPYRRAPGRLSRHDHFFQYFPYEPIDSRFPVIAGAIDICDGELISVVRRHGHREAAVGIERTVDCAVRKASAKGCFNLNFG